MIGIQQTFIEEEMTKLMVGKLYKGPDMKYCRLCKPYGFFLNY